MSQDTRPPSRTSPASGGKPAGRPHEKAGSRGDKPFHKAKSGGASHDRRAAARHRPTHDDEAPTEVWLWGTHAVKAALANPLRHVRQVLVTRNAARDFDPDVQVPWEVRQVLPDEIDDALPRGAVHQGIAALCAPLEPLDLGTLLAPAEGLLVLLDQVTDPQNVGAVLRSAAAFGARGIILQDRKAPPFSGGCAKAAVGAAEIVPHARVVNLSRAVEEAREAGWRSIALVGDAELTIEAALADAGPAVILALGAEDRGLRPSVREACDVAARIPISDAVESLNVSNAAALALYAARSKGGGRHDG